MALGSARTVCGRLSTELRALGSRAIATAVQLISPPLTASASQCMTLKAYLCTNVKTQTLSICDFSDIRHQAEYGGISLKSRKTVI